MANSLCTCFSAEGERPRCPRACRNIASSCRELGSTVNSVTGSSSSHEYQLSDKPERIILKRPAEVMTSIRVALMGKRSACPRPCPGPVSGQKFQQSCGDKFLAVVDDAHSVEMRNEMKSRSVRDAMLSKCRCYDCRL